MLDKFFGFYDFEIAKAERNLAIFLDRSTIDEKTMQINRMNFLKHMHQHDARRDTNFIETFPEFTEIFLKSHYNW